MIASPVLVGAVTVLIVIVGVYLAYNANKGLPFAQDPGAVQRADDGIRTHDPRFTRAVLWPTELRRRGGRV